MTIGLVGRAKYGWGGVEIWLVAGEVAASSGLCERLLQMPSLAAIASELTAIGNFNKPHVLECNSKSSKTYPSRWRSLQ